MISFLSFSLSYDQMGLIFISKLLESYRRSRLKRKPSLLSSQSHKPSSCAFPLLPCFPRNLHRLPATHFPHSITFKTRLRFLCKFLRKKEPLPALLGSPFLRSAPRSSKLLLPMVHSSRPWF